MNGKRWLIVVGIVVLAASGLYFAVSAGYITVSFSYCRGITYDVWKCTAERVEKCIATEKFTRDECIRMVSK